MTVKNTKIQLQFRKAARLMDKNNRLAAENTALKQKLQEQPPWFRRRKNTGTNTGIF